MAQLDYKTEVKFMQAIHTGRYTVIESMIIDKTLSADHIINVWTELNAWLTSHEAWKLLLLFDTTRLPFEKLKLVFAIHRGPLTFFFLLSDELFNMFKQFVDRYGVDFFLVADPYFYVLHNEVSDTDKILRRLYEAYPQFVDSTTTKNSPFMWCWFNSLHHDYDSAEKRVESFLRICKPDLNTPYVCECATQEQMRKEGILPLQYAIRTLSDQFERMLLKYGDGIDYTSGKCALDEYSYLPIESYWKDCSAILLEKFPISIHKNACAWTQLIMRTLSRNYSRDYAIGQLMSHGLRFTLPDTHTWASDTCMYLLLTALCKNGPDKLNLLVSFGLDVNRRDARGWSLVVFAVLLNEPVLTRYFEAIARPELELATLDSSMKSELEKALSCTVCMELMYNPTLIGACGHVTCSACASKVTQCPECRSQVKLTRLYNFDGVLSVLTRKKGRAEQ
jgi:hypothetical protein